jgi:hypothetical protein
MEKAGVSLFWTLHEASGGGQKLIAYWSRMVEHYVSWLFAQAYQGSGHVLPSPNFEGTSDQFCDLCVVEGMSLIAFEVKASTLTVGAKFGFSAGVLLQELKAKAIEGDQSPKGVTQLANSLKRFVTGEEVSGLDRRRITRVYPALVFLDPSFVALYVKRLYKERFDRRNLEKEYKKTGGFRITPLYAITVEDLERILPFTRNVSLTEILDSYYRYNAEMPGSVFQSCPAVHGAKQGDDPVLEKFDSFIKDLEESFFRDVASEVPKS